MEVAVPIIEGWTTEFDSMDEDVQTYFLHQGLTAANSTHHLASPSGQVWVRHRPADAAAAALAAPALDPADEWPDVEQGAPMDWVGAPDREVLPLYMVDLAAEPDDYYDSGDYAFDNPGEWINNEMKLYQEKRTRMRIKKEAAEWERAMKMGAGEIVDLEEEEEQ